MKVRKQFRNGTRFVTLPILGLGMGVGTFASHANAATEWFDVNGATTGSGVTNNGAYNWDDPNWSLDTTGASVTGPWTDGDFPRFSAGTTDVTGNYSVTMNTNHSCAGMFFEADGAPTPTTTIETLTIQGTGAMTIAGGVAQGWFASTNRNFKINVKLTGSGGVSWGGGGGSLFLYGANDYTFGTILAAANGININSNQSFGTGPLSWTTTAAIIADPDATAPITISNTVLGKTNPLPTTGTIPTNVSFILAGAQKMTFTSPSFPITPGTGSVTTTTQTFQVGNTTFPNSAAQIDGAITQDPALPMPLIKTGPGTLTVTNANNHWGNGLNADTKVANGTLVIGNATAIPSTSLLVDSTGQAAPVVAPVARYQAGLPTAAQMITIKTVGAGSVDLTNNSLVINTFNNADPGNSTMSAAQVRALLTSGYNAGAWNGPGINSSSAATDPNHATSIGYADNTVLHRTEFKGLTLDANGVNANDILLKYTYAGDANLDGKVDIGDLGLLAGAWQAASGKVWFDGDFTYDGAVDIGDLGLLAGNWQKGTDGNPNPPLMDFSTAMAQFSAFDGVIVPEPAGLSLLALGGLAMSRRSRRRA